MQTNRPQTGCKPAALVALFSFFFFLPQPLKVLLTAGLIRPAGAGSTHHSHSHACINALSRQEPLRAACL